MEKTESKKTARTAAVPEADYYTAQELAAAAPALFHVMPECMTAALATAGLTHATKAQAGEMLAKFMKKEVK